MNLSPSETPKAGGLAQSLTRLLVGAVVGGGAAWIWFTHAAGVDWIDALTLGLSLVCLLGATRLIFESFNRRALAVRMQVEGETTPKETGQARLAAGLMVVLGLVLLLPAASRTFGWIDPRLAYAGIVAFAVLRVLYTWHVVRTGDEFLKRRMHEASWKILVLFSLGLLLYGGAERLDLVAEGSIWDAFVILTGLSLIVPAIGPVRRST